MIGGYPVLWSDLGRVGYRRSFDLQGSLRQRAGLPGNPGYVLFLEHPPTITLGYSLRGDEGRSAIVSSPERLASEGIDVIQVDRGGKATYHGPGQLVCYLILSLKELRLGVKRFVGKIENVVLESLKLLGLEPGLDPHYPGVWLGGAKVAAVGIRVADRVSTHGFAINIDPDLSAFGHIVPCGISDRPVTSLKAQEIEVPDRNKMIELLLTNLEKEMRLSPSRLAPEEVLSELSRRTG